MAISISIAPYITEVTVSSNITEIQANLALADVGAASVAITPTGYITATDLQGALEQVAAQDYRSPSTPTGSNVEIGDTWYDTQQNIFYVYRTVDGTTDWFPLVTTDEDGVQDGGAF
jgi:hypothetical protein